MTQHPALPEQSAIATYIPDARWHQAFVNWMFNLRSEKTRVEYRYDWNLFLDTAKVEPQAVTREMVIAYREMLTKADYSNTAVARKLASLSSFYNYAIKEGLTDFNPTSGVTRPRVKKYGHATYLKSEEEVKRLLNAIDTSTIKGKRDYALIMMLLNTAVRSAVPESLKLKDIYDFKSDSFKPMQFVNKGGEERMMALPEPLQNALTAYLCCRENLTPESYVFASVYSEKPLSNSNLNRILKHWLGVAGLPESLHVHSMRHTAVRLAAQDGWTISELRSFSMHSDIGSLVIYLDGLDDKGGDIAATLARRFE